MTHAPPEIILGIDLGTTFSVAAWVDSRGPHVLRDDAGDARLPSVIGLDVDSAGRPSVTVGWEARRRAVERPEATVYSIKRLIGKGPDELREELPFLAYAVKSGPHEAVRVEIAGREYSPEEISSVILRTLKDRAEAAIGRPVYKAVITVPAYFDDAQRQATRHAGMAAGLEVVRIINEPTAAALAYGIGLKAGASAAPAAREPVELTMPRCHDSTGPTDAAAGAANARTVIVYDLGGGTFDVSILRIDGDVFQVLATAGDTHLGGDDFDRTVITLVQREVADRFGVSIDSPAARQALRTLAESVKIRLSEAESAAIELDLGPERAFHREISRSEFESLVEPLIERTITLCRRALADARLGPEDISEFILVGGSTRIPRVRAAVAELAGKPPYTALNPDEVVAVGAAMQAAVLAGVELDLLLLDVTPLSLGIETMGGAVSKLIMKNSTVPCRAVEQFTTFVDGQTSIQVNVYQGERELTRDCRLLGAFTLSGLPPMPAGIPKVEVEFLIDANGILTVSAREQRSGREAGVQIIPNHGLTREELERIERDSIAHARDDVRAHRRIDLVNQVRFDTHKAEQMLARVGNAFPPDERAAVEHSIRELRALADRAANDLPPNVDGRNEIPDASNDLDELQRALNAFGRGTLRLAELGIRTALQDR